MRSDPPCGPTYYMAEREAEQQQAAAAASIASRGPGRRGRAGLVPTCALELGGRPFVRPHRAAHAKSRLAIDPQPARSTVRTEQRPPDDHEQQGPHQDDRNDGPVHVADVTTFRTRACWADALRSGRRAFEPAALAREAAPAEARRDDGSRRIPLIDTACGRSGGVVRVARRAGRAGTFGPLLGQSLVRSLRKVVTRTLA